MLQGYWNQARHREQAMWGGTGLTFDPILQAKVTKKEILNKMLDETLRETLSTIAQEQEELMQASNLDGFAEGAVFQSEEEDEIQALLNNLRPVEQQEVANNGSINSTELNKK